MLEPSFYQFYVHMNTLCSRSRAACGTMTLRLVARPEHGSNFLDSSVGGLATASRRHCLWQLPLFFGLVLGNASAAAAGLADPYAPWPGALRSPRLTTSRTRRWRGRWPSSAASVSAPAPTATTRGCSATSSTVWGPNHRGARAGARQGPGRSPRRGLGGRGGARTWMARTSTPRTGPRRPIAANGLQRNGRGRNAFKSPKKRIRKTL